VAEVENGTEEDEMNITKLDALGDSIIVRRRSHEEKSMGLIHVAEPSYRFAEVLSVGPDVTGLSVGDVVCLEKSAGTPIDYSGRDTDIVVRVKDLFGKVAAR
jgi:co-chaperonin GroES (HSP10)